MDSKSSNRILVVHPEGGILYNNGLSSLVSFLREDGFCVEYATPFLRGSISRVKGKLVDKVYISKQLFFFFLRLRVIIVSALPFINLLLGAFSVSPWRLVIGIDSDGIVVADLIARALNCPSALLSYELFFCSEIGAFAKSPEIEACKRISFAVCQGGERSYHLSIENHIHPSKIIDIPVAPCGEYSCPPNPPDLKNLFGISQAYVAIVAGTLDDWTLVDALLASTHFWPRDWSLLVHSRFGIDRKLLDHLLLLGADNVYISNLDLASSADVMALFSQADLGIALYRPSYENKWLGKNIACLGLSSGKISMYLQAGLPVLTNAGTGYQQLFDKYDAGLIVDHPSEIGEILAKNSSRLYQMRVNALNLYRSELDSNLYRSLFIRSVRACLH